MNLNYIRFKKVLDDILTKTTPETPYTITSFGQLQPQSYCTKLREAYKFLRETSPFDAEHVFSWSPTKVTVRIKGTTTKSLEPFEPQHQTIKANTKDPGHINALCMLCYHEVFELPVELPGIIPPLIAPFVETTQLPHSYLIH